MMSSNQAVLKNRNVVAWVLMISAIAVHVLDETMTDFLPFYNQLVMDLRKSIGFFPMATFSFELWLGGLIFFVALGFAMTPLVNRGGRFPRILSTVLGILMIANACAHLIGSILLGGLVPGFWSSPFLLVTAVYVVVSGLRAQAWTPDLR